MTGASSRSSASPSTYRKQLIGLSTTWVFALLPANLVPSIIGRLVSDFGVEVTAAGFVATGMTLANAAAVLVLQPIAARGHRKLLARLGALLLMIPLLIGLITLSATVIMVALVIGGIGSGMIIAASSAAVSATATPDAAANVVMIINRLVVAIAFFLIPAIGGGLQSTMLIMIVPGIVAVIGAQWLPSAPSADDGLVESAERSPGTRFFETVDRRRVRVLGWVLAVGFGAWSITDDGVFGLLEVFAGDNIPGVGADFVPTLAGFSILCGLVGAVIALPVSRRLGRFPVLATAFALSIISKLGLILGTSQLVFSISSCLWGFVFGLMLPIVMGIAAQMTRDGSVSVLVNGVYILGVALGPTISSQIYSAAGNVALALSMTALALVTGIMMLVVARVGDRGASIQETVVLEKEGATK